MRQFLYLSVFSVAILLSACSESFKKGDEGMEYKIISKGSGKQIGYGNYMQMHITQLYKGTKDTVLADTRDYKPRIEIFDSVSTPPAYYKIIRQLRKGDSLVIRMITDSVFKKNPGGMPPYMKKGKYLYTTVKLVNIFESLAQADSADKAEDVTARPKMFKRQMEAIEKDMATNKDMIAKDVSTIQDYLTKNNIKATKTKWGTFVSIINEGSGEKINENHQVIVNYTGKTFDSSLVFDSNVDPKFQHVQPYMVPMNQPGSSVILGWTDGLMTLKKGSKAVFYIPSSLGYGSQGRLPAIKPNDILVFDIEVLDVMTEAQAMAKAQADAEAAQQKIAEAEKKRLEGLNKK